MPNTHFDAAQLHILMLPNYTLWKLGPVIYTMNIDLLQYTIGLGKKIGQSGKRRRRRSRSLQ